LAELPKVRIAYRSFPKRLAALLWAAEQQGNRRNASREAQCLSVLRALARAGDLDDYTRAELAERLGYGDATVGRGQQVLARGTESEIVAVLEGKHGAEEGVRADQGAREGGRRAARRAPRETGARCVAGDRRAGR
jgi:hypothetical protein